MKLFARAKINLSLRILGRRDDGFHELESLMTPISLGDTLEVSRREKGGIEFICDDLTIPLGEENLVVRAVRVFCGATGVAPDLRIGLTKRIPHGAGLGGGSSDAATILLGLNQLFGTGLSRDELSVLGASLGSDVPFFVYESAARIGGRGERVDPVVLGEKLSLVLMKPSFGVSTPWAYSRWKESREIPSVRYGVQDFRWGGLLNDLERPVFEKYLLLADIKMWLLGQAEVVGALMSGSGSTMFAVLDEGRSGEGLVSRIREEFGVGMWVRAVETVG
jgi:4-diphosphocytidyl-2-C-methyl-D-erythritol kinase